MQCCVPFCKNTAEIVSETKEITFHEFPREVHLRAAWLRALGKQDALLPAGAVVCSQHFLNDEILETENGSRQIRTGAVPATVLICLICLDTRNQLLLMSEHNLELAYQDLVGHPPCVGGRLKHTLCVQCAQRLVDFSTFRDESLRARCLMTELLHTHEVITRRHVALLSRYKRPLPSDIEPDTAPDATATVAAATATDATDVAVAVKQEVEHREHVDTAACAYNADSIATAARALRERCEAREDAPAAAEAATETQPPIEREQSCEPESLEERNQALVAPVVLATNPGNEEYPIEFSDDWDISSFENNANVLEDPLKLHDAELISKESMAKISDSIDYRTRRDDRLTSEQRKHSQGMLSTLLGNHIDRTQYICDVCQKIFQTKVSLVSHIRAHAFAKTLSCKLKEGKLNQNHTLSSLKTTRTEPFACELCKYKSTLKSNLLRHMRTHTGEKPFGCKLCSYKSAHKANLVNHMRTHTGEKPFGCKLCMYKSAQKANFVNHMRTHTGEMPFTYKLCKYNCTENSKLVRHMRTHTGEMPFACELCKYKCTLNSSLVKHMRTHTGEKPFTCELCNYKSTQNSNLVKHMRTHTGEKPFGCELCNYKCTEKSNLVKHMSTHTGKKPFACEIRNYKCTVNNSLVHHTRTHTGEKPFACKLCKYKFTQKNYLVRHMRTHTGEKPFACELCKYKCKLNSSLVKHMRTHTGEKPFACGLCKYKSTQNGNLVKHMRTHTGEKPFGCELCNYKCTEKSNLVKHMSTHTGEKPFAYEIRNYKCTVNNSFVNHMRADTGEKHFACKLCKYKFTQKSSLVSHMRTHTGEKPVQIHTKKVVEDSHWRKAFAH